MGNRHLYNSHHFSAFAIRLPPPWQGQASDVAGGRWPTGPEGERGAVWRPCLPRQTHPSASCPTGGMRPPLTVNQIMHRRRLLRFADLDDSQTHVGASTDEHIAARTKGKAGAGECMGILETPDGCERSRREEVDVEVGSAQRQVLTVLAAARPPIVSLFSPPPTLAPTHLSANTVAGRSDTFLVLRSVHLSASQQDTKLAKTAMSAEWFVRAQLVLTHHRLIFAFSRSFLELPRPVGAFVLTTVKSRSLRPAPPALPLRPNRAARNTQPGVPFKDGFRIV